MSAIATTNNGAGTVASAPLTPVAIVSKQIRNMMETGTIHLPSDYSAENALKAAWLILQEIKDKDKRRALDVCTHASIVNALHDMVIQGLNPAKKQCYFIVYGNILTLQRSYFGDELLVKRVMPGAELYSGIVYEGDVFEYTMVRGRKVVSNHSQKLENIRPDKIVAAYCGVIDTTIGAEGQDMGCEIMTIEQIHTSWKKSKQFGPTSFHNEQPDEACKRTVARRRCKPIINASSDACLMEAIRRSHEDLIEAELEEEMALTANAAPLELPQDTSTIQASEPASDHAEPVAERIGTPPAAEPGF